jgi:hypothetical protein
VIAKLYCTATRSDGESHEYYQRELKNNFSFKQTKQNLKAFSARSEVN